MLVARLNVEDEDEDDVVGGGCCGRRCCGRRTSWVSDDDEKRPGVELRPRRRIEEVIAADPSLWRDQFQKTKEQIKAAE